MAMNRASRDYVIQFGGAMAAYAVVLFASIALIQHTQLALPLRGVVALAPLVPLVFALLAFVRFLRRMDELQRRIQLEALGFGFGATAILTFGYGFLENVGFPHLSYFAVLPTMLLLWGAASAVASMRYR